MRGHSFLLDLPGDRGLRGRHGHVAACGACRLADLVTLDHEREIVSVTRLLVLDLQLWDDFSHLLTLP